MRRRRNSRALLVAAVLAAAACGPDLASRKVRLEAPSRPEVDLAAVPEIVLAGFWLEKEVKDFDLNRDLAAYLKEELKRSFKGRVSEKAVAWTGADMLGSPEAWAKAGLGPAGALVLSGKAEFTGESRKALLDAEARTLDGPFEPGNPWSEKKNYSLKLEVVLLKAGTGETVFRKEFKETLTYDNKKQPAAYAFYDLLDRARPRLARALFGSDRALDRYLLTK
jgi:hypothetical protein